MSQELDPVDVAAALRASTGLFVRQLRRSPVRDELSAPEMSALSRLDRGGPATPSELARAERITPQAMGATLHGLAKRGLVERRADPGDGRRTVMSLSETGRRVMRDKRSARTRQIAEALSDGFTAGEREILMLAAPLIERLADRI